MPWCRQIGRRSGDSFFFFFLISYLGRLPYPVVFWLPLSLRSNSSRVRLGLFL